MPATASADLSGVWTDDVPRCSRRLRRCAAAATAPTWPDGQHGRRRGLLRRGRLRLPLAADDRPALASRARAGRAGLRIADGDGYRRRRAGAGAVPRAHAGSRRSAADGGRAVLADAHPSDGRRATARVCAGRRSTTCTSRPRLRALYDQIVDDPTRARGARRDNLRRAGPSADRRDHGAAAARAGAGGRDRHARRRRPVLRRGGPRGQRAPVRDHLQIADALALPPLAPTVPLLVYQVYKPTVASDLKLALLRLYPPEHAALVIQGAATALEQGRAGRARRARPRPPIRPSDHAVTSRRSRPTRTSARCPAWPTWWRGCGGRGLPLGRAADSR